MVNTVIRPSVRSMTDRLAPVARLVGAYFAVVAATLVVLGILSATAPHQATSSAWWHAVIVAVLAGLLALRLRAARRGSARAVVAVRVIASVLLVANAVEAALPHAFPTWMRCQMVLVAVLMAGVVLLALRARRA